MPVLAAAGHVWQPQTDQAVEDSDRRPRHHCGRLWLDKDKPGGGMFEVRNSWGDNWGSDGYAYLSFELLQQNH
jgi:hypothetical protein